MYAREALSVQKLWLLGLQHLATRFARWVRQSTLGVGRLAHPSCARLIQAWA